MAQVYYPWGLFAGAVGAAILYLQLMPEIFARQRWGGLPGLEGRLFWPCAGALLALFVWPFVAAVQIDWGRRPPTVWSLALMTFGAAVLGYFAQLAAQRLVASRASGVMDDAQAVELMQLLRRFNGGTTLALLALTGAAYWAVSPSGQLVMCGRYGC